MIVQGLSLLALLIAGLGASILLNRRSPVMRRASFSALAILLVVVLVWDVLINASLEIPLTLMTLLLFLLPLLAFVFTLFVSLRTRGAHTQDYDDVFAGDAGMPYAEAGRPGFPHIGIRGDDADGGGEKQGNAVAAIALETMGRVKGAFDSADNVFKESEKKDKTKALNRAYEKARSENVEMFASPQVVYDTMEVDEGLSADEGEAFWELDIDTSEDETPWNSGSVASEDAEPLQPDLLSSEDEAPWQPDDAFPEEKTPGEQPYEETLSDRRAEASAAASVAEPDIEETDIQGEAIEEHDLQEQAWKEAFSLAETRERERQAAMEREEEEAQRAAQRETERLMRLEAEQREAEQRAREEAARERAEAEARAKAEEKARIEAAEAARLRAEERARAEAERAARMEAERAAREALEQAAREQAEAEAEAHEEFESIREKAAAYRSRGAGEIALMIYRGALPQAPNSPDEHQMRFDLIECLVGMQRFEEARMEIIAFMTQANNIKRSEKMKLKAIDSLIEGRESS